MILFNREGVKVASFAELDITQDELDAVLAMAHGKPEMFKPEADPMEPCDKSDDQLIVHTQYLVNRMNLLRQEGARAPSDFLPHLLEMRRRGMLKTEIKPSEEQPTSLFAIGGLALLGASLTAIAKLATSPPVRVAGGRIARADVLVEEQQLNDRVCQ
jgi:hypothetical protein